MPDRLAKLRSLTAPPERPGDRLAKLRLLTEPQRSVAQAADASRTVRPREDTRPVAEQLRPSRL